MAFSRSRAVNSDTLKETDLYPPLKAWLKTQGYRVRGEVGRCDLAAEKDGELIAMELKLRPSLALLAQATERQEYADSVYVVLPVLSDRRRSPASRGFCRLLRRLGLGLVVVTFLKTKARVEVVMHPDPGEGMPRRRPKTKAALLREIAGRDLDLTPGGLAGSRTRVSAYRQRCVRVAVLLGQLGPSSPAELKKRGAHGDTGRILSRNLYGWFERIRRGSYRLHPAGKIALEELSELAALYRGSEKGAVREDPHAPASPKQVSMDRAWDIRG